MYKRVNKIGLLLVLCLLFNTQTANALTTGTVWNEDIIFWVTDEVKQSDIYPQVIEAIDEWNSVLSSADANIVLDIHEGTMEPNAILEFKYVPGPGIAKGKPSKNEYSGDYYGEAELHLQKDKVMDYSEKARKALLMHELGHILGLKHAPDNEESIMRQVLEDFYHLDKPTIYDINDIKTIY